jgi:hypothetical protein
MGMSLLFVSLSILSGIAHNEYVVIVDRSIKAPIANQEKLIPKTIPRDFMTRSLRNAGLLLSLTLKIYCTTFRNITHPMAKFANVLLRFRNIYNGLSRLINSP